MKPGIKTTELSTTALGGAGIAVLVRETWDAQMSVGAGIALGLACAAIAFAVVQYGMGRAKTKGGGS